MASDAGARPFRPELVGGFVGLVGALLIIPACLLPFANYPPTSDTTVTTPSIFDPGFDGALWYAAEPVSVILIGIAGSLLIVFSRRALVQIAGAAGIIGIGVQTFFLFVGYGGYALSQRVDSLGIGSVLGLAGGFCLVVGGVITAVIVGVRSMPPQLPGPI